MSGMDAVEWDERVDEARKRRLAHNLIIAEAFGGSQEIAEATNAVLVELALAPEHTEQGLSRYAAQRVQAFIDHYM